MLDCLSGAVKRGIHTSLCYTLDLHTPGAALKSAGPFFYGRCRVCSGVITRTGSTTWRSAPDVHEEHFAEMRNVSTEFLRVARD